MSAFPTAIRAFTADLADLRAQYALIGGLAVSVRTEPRFTQDIDVAIAVMDDAAAESLVHNFLSRRYSVTALIEHEARQRLATARLQSPHGEQIVDLLFASSGIEAEIAADAESLEIMPGVRLPVARTGHLIALKLLARDDETRPLDWADLLSLVRAADQVELNLAKHAVDLIEERGYNRGRDLVGALNELLTT